MDTPFTAAMRAGYALSEPAIELGRPMLDGTVVTDVPVRVGLSMLNRHGLVAGATGTGKTKTLQLLAGQLSAAGVPCFVADVKGDVTGIAEPGDPANPKVVQRCETLGVPFTPAGHPVELLSLTGKLGAPVRATVHSFGPTLLAKVLDLNETQTAVLSLVFAYCDDGDLPLLDLADLRTTLQYLGTDAAKDAVAAYGGISTATIGVILRSILMLEQQGAEAFFGEPEFDVADLLRTVPGPGGTDHGVVSLLELSDVMDRPRLFSTFMLWLLAQLYVTLPEVGDLPRPKLCFFFDEAHLLFQDASPALMEQIERTARLIRSKGVGLFFVTQAPTDVPSSVLGQLGNRVQHALRAFTPEDADDLRKTVRTFPTSPYYTDVGATLTSLGIGEALVTVLSPNGVPTPLAATRLLPPDSLMAALTPDRVAALVAASPLAAKYREPVDRESAHEMITRRIAEAKAAAPAVPAQTPAQVAREERARTRDLQRQQAVAEREAKAEARRLERERLAAERDAIAEARRLERERAAAERAAAREETAARRAAERQQQEMIRAGTRILTSRTGQQAIRSVFGTLFGGSARR